MNLTFDQQEGLDKLLEFNQEYYNNIFILSGSAGTGKSTLMRYYLQESDKKIKLTSTTNKASKVLKEVTGLDACTIHSFLGLKPKKVKGEFILKQDSKRYKDNIEGIDTVVVDESSMLNSEVLSFVIKDIESYGRSYVMVGDFCQLPPVNEEFSPVSELAKDGEGHQLTEIIRQKEGNPIIEFATVLRNMLIDNKKYPLIFGSNDHGGIVNLHRKEFDKKIKEQNWADPDTNKILSWTNRNCHYYNRVVNHHLGIDVTLPFDVESNVIFNSAYIQGDEVIRNTGHEGIVESVELKLDNASGIEYYDVSLVDDINLYKVIKLSSIGKYRFYSEELKQDALSTLGKGTWPDYYSFVERWCDIRPNFAMTVHSAQGSGYDNVFIDYYNMKKNSNKKELTQMLYTAVTRAYNNVYMCLEE